MTTVLKVYSLTRITWARLRVPPRPRTKYSGVTAPDHPVEAKVPITRGPNGTVCSQFMYNLFHFGLTDVNFPDSHRNDVHNHVEEN